MSKAILVMDMPKSCEMCRLHSFWGSDLDVLCKIQCKAQSFEDACKGRPSWCPLREVPKKKDRVYERPCLSYGEGWDKGYNEAIDEILGKDV